MFSSGQDVIFSASGASNQNTTLGGAVTAKSLTINDTAAVTVGGADTLTLAGALNAITIGNGAGAATISANVALTSANNITVNSANGLTVSGQISGNVGLKADGTGLLILSGNNVYTGGTTLASGVVQINSATSLGDVSGAATFTGGTLQLAASVTTNRSYIFSSGASGIDTNGNILTLAGTVSGSGGYTKTGLGQILITGTNSYNGTATINQGSLTFVNTSFPAAAGGSTYTTGPAGTVEFSDSAATNFTPAGPVVFSGTGTFLKSGVGTLQVHPAAGGSATFAMTGGVLDVAGGIFQNGGPGGAGSPVWTNNKSALQVDNDTWDGAAPNFDALLGAGTITKSGFSFGQVTTLTLGNNGGSGTFSGTITNSLGTLSLAKTGAGTQIFSGANSYSGTTAISNGTLSVTNNTGLGFGGKTFASAANGGTSINGLTSVTGGATLNLSGVTMNEVITLNASNLVNNGASPSIIDNGVAQVLLTSTSTTGSGSGYTSPIVNFSSGSAAATAGQVGGVVQNITLTSAGSGYTSAPTVTITDGGPGTGAIATAVLSSVALTGANNIGGSGDLTVNAVISGAGGFTKVGGGNLTLNAANTYFGTTTVSGGSLFVNGSTFNSATTVAAGTLGGNGSTLGTISVTTGSMRTGFNSAGVHFATVNDATNITPNISATSLTLSSTATYVLDIGAASGVTNGLGNPIGLSSLLYLAGDVSPGGATLQINDSGVAVTQNEVFKFVQYDGVWDATTFGTVNSAAGNTYAINYAAGDPFVELSVVTPVPEPSTVVVTLGTG